MPQLRNLVLPVLLAVMPMQAFAQDAPVNMAPIIAYLLSDSSTPPPIEDTTPPSFTSEDEVDINENTTTVISITTDDSSATLTLGGADADKFNLVGNALSFKVAPDYEEDAKTYSVTITATDGSGNEAFQTISISVLDVNDNVPSFINASTASADEERNFRFLSLEIADGDTPQNELVLSVVTDELDGSFFSIDTAINSLYFTDAVDFDIPADSDADNIYNVKVSVSDGDTTAYQTITVSLININDNAPVLGAYDSRYYIPEGQTEIVTLLASDADGNVVTFDFDDTNTSIFNLNTSTGEVSLKEAFDYETMGDVHSFQVSFFATDGDWESAYSSFIVEITDVAGSPVISSASTVDVAEDSTIVLTVTATDDEGEDMSYAIEAGANGALFSINSISGVLTLDAPKDFEDGDSNSLSVNISVTDETLHVTNQTITVNITDVNEAPSITSSSTVTLNEEETNPTVISVISEDVDAGTSLEYSLFGGADMSKFNIDSSSGVLSMNITPDREIPVDDDTNNIYNVEVEVSDGSLSDRLIINVTIDNINDNSPTFDGLVTISSDENILSFGVIPASDADGDNINYSITAGADSDSLSINSSTGELTFNDVPDFENPASADGDNTYELTISINDSVHSAVEESFSLSITDAISSQMIEVANENGTVATDGIWSAFGTHIYKYENGLWNKHSDIPNRVEDGFTVYPPAYSMVLQGEKLVMAYDGVSSSYNKRIDIYEYDSSSDSWVLEFTDKTLDDISTSYYTRTTCEGTDRLALDGNTIALGYPNKDGTSTAGSVYIYKYDGTTWVQTVLSEASPATDNAFGCDVALENNTLVVGSPRGDDGGENYGSVYIYKYADSSWGLEHTLNGTKQYGSFGAKVAIQNNNLLVTGLKDTTSSTGMVHYFAYNGIGDYTKTDIEPTTASSGFGSELAWKDNFVVISDKDDKENNGAHYLYTKSGAVFTQVAKIINPTIGGSLTTQVVFNSQYLMLADDNKAYAYNYLAGDELAPRITTAYSVVEGMIPLGLVADDLQDGHAMSTLSVSLGGDDASKFSLDSNKNLNFNDFTNYEICDDANGDCVYDITITADDGTHTTQESVSITVTNSDKPYVATQLLYKEASSDYETSPNALDTHANRMVVGLLNESVDIYEHDGSSWVLMQNIVADNAGSDLFGESVAIYGDYIIVGARYEDTAGSNAGAAYLYYYNGSDWNQIAMLQPSSVVNVGDYFGGSVDIDGTHIAVGANQDDENQVGAGAVYVFTYSSSNASLVEKLAPTGNSFNIGESVAISGNTIATAGKGAHTINNDQGFMVYTDTNNDGSFETSTAVESDVINNSMFGAGDIAFDGSSLFIGDVQANSNKGAVYVYAAGQDGWRITETISNSETGFFGSSLALDGDTILIGASGNDSSEVNTGAVFIYTKSATWGESAKLVGFESSHNESFGTQVGFGVNSTLIFGAEGLVLDGITTGGIFSFSAE